MMAATRDAMVEEEVTRATAIVRAVRTRPGRAVLTADGTPDAWIASDLLVEPRA